MSNSKQHFLEARNFIERVLETPDFLNAIDNAVVLMSASLKSGGKIISCGNGGSMADAIHFAEELSGNFRNKRRALAGLSLSDSGHLSCVANDFGYEEVFARGVEAFGSKGDVLLAISTSGNSENIIRAARVARELDMKVVALSGKDGGKLSEVCDIEIRVPIPNAAYADRIQEIHGIAIHALIDGIEGELFSSKD